MLKTPFKARNDYNYVYYLFQELNIFGGIVSRTKRSDPDYFYKKKYLDCDAARQRGLEINIFACLMHVIQFKTYFSGCKTSKSQRIKHFRIPGTYFCGL